jgi:type IV secretion system protein VirB4
MLTVLRPADAFPILGPYEDTGLFLARDGSLCAFIATEGRDPDGLDTEAVNLTTIAARNALLSLPTQCRIQTIHWHHRAAPAAPRTRHHAIIDAIETRRHAHLAARHLYRSRTLVVLSLPTLAVSQHRDYATLLSSIWLTPFRAGARALWKRALSPSRQYVYLRRELDDGARRLLDTADAYLRRWSMYADTRLLSPSAAWGWSRALASLDPSCIDANEPAPASDWDTALLHGTVATRHVSGAEHLCIETPQPRYARLANVTTFGGRVEPGWSLKSPSPLTVRGDYLLATHARGLTGLERASAFFAAENALRRDHLSLTDALRRAADQHSPVATAASAEQNALAAGLDELYTAQRLEDRWFRAQHMMIALDTTTDAVRETALALDTSLSQHGVHLVWATPETLETYGAIQPGAEPFHARTHLHNATQVAAAAPIWRHSNGTLRVEDLGGEEPLILLETLDGGVFGFSPFVGEKSTLIGCGPSRSGKTLAKNVLAAHWPKWGGFAVAIDYDDGSHALARLYGDDGLIVSGDAGMNPFASPVHDGEYRAHLSRLVLSILATNDDPAMRALAAGEQREIDTAIDQVLRLPSSMRNLSSFAAHLPPAIAHKLARWLRDREGRYAALLDHDQDHAGRIDRLITAYSLRSLRDDSAARGPVTTELLWRITRAFEDPSNRTKPKTLIIDEAHYELRSERGGAFHAVKARTWAKMRGSLQMWSQRPGEFADCSDWDGLRGSAATFLFTADPEAGDAHRAVFGLTEADVATIRDLVPKRDLYLVQPDTGLRKRLILSPDASVLVWASSTAAVAAERDRLAAVHGLTHAIDTLTAAPTGGLTPCVAH